MNAEIIIKDKAAAFVRTLGHFVDIQKGAPTFQMDLRTALYTMNEPSDRLIFLHAVISSVNAKHNDHLKTCKTADQTKCSYSKYFNLCKYYLEQEVKALNPSFEYTQVRPLINFEVLNRNLIQLKDYPEVSKIYLAALEKLKDGKNERNILDDLRLSIETLLKAKLNNQKSLENQKEALGQYLKLNHTSKELTGMFLLLLDYFCKYHNDHIKHNDAVKKDEVDLIINLSTSFISFLINK